MLFIKIREIYKNDGVGIGKNYLIKKVGIYQCY